MKKIVVLSLFVLCFGCGDDSTPTPSPLPFESGDSANAVDTIKNRFFSFSAELPDTQAFYDKSFGMYRAILEAGAVAPAAAVVEHKTKEWCEIYYERKVQVGYPMDVTDIAKTASPDQLSRFFISINKRQTTILIFVCATPIEVNKMTVGDVRRIVSGLLTFK